MKHLSLTISLTLLLSSTAIADFTPASSWRSAKNNLDDHVYNDQRHTFYCGCEYTSKGTSTGSGTINADACGLQDVPKKRGTRNRVEWEHIVPASLMPVGGYMCWQKETEVQACQNSDGKVTKKNRQCCDKVSPSGRLMMYDLFNIAPAASQLNQYRTNDPYGEIPDGSEFEDFGAQCEAKDLNGTTSGPSGLFEPPDCKKGDVARTWFYMRLAHGVVIDTATEALFFEWSANDPVSPWERTRHDRIAAIQGNGNPYVEGTTPDTVGSCSWEP